MRMKEVSENRSTRECLCPPVQETWRHYEDADTALVRRPETYSRERVLIPGGFGKRNNDKINHKVSSRSISRRVSFVGMK